MRSINEGLPPWTTNSFRQVWSSLRCWIYLWIIPDWD